MSEKKAVIIGAGPAGLTAAVELLKKTGIKPVIFESSAQVGGISKTVNYKGNRIDIGGHRFFSKSERIVRWWQDILPLQGAPARDDVFLEREVPLSQDPAAPDPEMTDAVMLVRPRLSRIFAFRKFFDYPISLSVQTLSNLGVLRVIRIFFSYVQTRLFPVRNEKTLQDFLINRFGNELYLTFFKSYTEKVWGVPCQEISADWGAQRIKGLSIMKAMQHAVGKIFSARDRSLTQKGKETSLIEQFMYPKLGPGQLWEEVAARVVRDGGVIHLEHDVVGVIHARNRIVSVQVKDKKTGHSSTIEGDFFFSTMPIKDLTAAMDPAPPADVQRVAGALRYRDFITVGLLLKRLTIRGNGQTKRRHRIILDNWIYIQEEDVRLGRVQIFNNWSPYMVKDPDTVWLGLEYFCDEGDDLWRKPDGSMTAFAVDELARIGFIDGPDDVIDGVVLRIPKTYPSYVGIYAEFDTVRRYMDTFENLFLIGRNGMHRYNNTDHSMMTAMVAVENIVAGIDSRENIWAVNMEKDYHEK